MNLSWVFTPIVLPLKNADHATAHAATLVWNNSASQVRTRDSMMGKTLQSVGLVDGVSIAWNKASIYHLTTNRIDDIPTLMRRTPSCPTQEYNRLGCFTQGAFSADGPPPSDMLERRTVAERFRPELSFGRDVVLALCADLASSGIILPSDCLSRVTPSEAHHLDQVSSDPASLRALWSSSRNDASSPSNSPAEYLSPSRELFTKDPARKRPADIPLNFRARERSRFVP